MVSVITLHRVKNYGSVLQAYALQKKIEDLGYKVEIIDYYPERLTIPKMLRGLKNKKSYLKFFLIRLAAQIIILPSYIARFKIFDKFIKNNLKLTKTYKNEKELIESDFNSGLFITGSDQVWNSEWNEKFDTPFYLTFVNIANKISYAASFGKINLGDEEVQLVTNALKKYKEITVRELSGVDILKKMGISSNVVADPTLLLNKEEWISIASNKFIKKKFILVYNLNRDKKLWNYAKLVSKKTGLPIYYVSYNLHDKVIGAKMIFCPKVFDFLSLFKYADTVITDSFHATVFSITFNKNFFIVYPNKFSTRIKSILEIVGLEGRVINDNKNVDITNIDYKNINEKLDLFRDKSLSLLKDMLKRHYIGNNKLG